MESWLDIVAEMRRFGENHWMHREGQSCREFADRIEKSCRTLEETWRIAAQSTQALHAEEVNALKFENAKLRRALEPVMDVILGGSSLTDSYEAVRKSQAIMKEGEK